VTEERESTIQSINNFATLTKAEIVIAAISQESASSHNWIEQEAQRNTGRE